MIVTRIPIATRSPISMSSGEDVSINASIPMKTP